jgi:formylglycine-generating enzyme required for sulfatase activity
MSDETISKMIAEMVLCPPGAFLMGSPEGRRLEYDHALHQVILTRGVWLGRTPVTQGQWQAVMRGNPSYHRGDPERPVEQVSWYEAQVFCRRLSLKTGMTFRLPTEAEWEYGCRAGATTDYCFGDDPTDLKRFAWYCEDLRQPIETQPVGRKAANAWGLYDMHGNVCEWCEDWYGPPYEAIARTDPRGPQVPGRYRVLRGGCIGSQARDCRATSRHLAAPTQAYAGNGFRVARSACHGS